MIRNNRIYYIVVLIDDNTYYVKLKRKRINRKNILLADSLIESKHSSIYIRGFKDAERIENSVRNFYKWQKLKPKPNISKKYIPFQELIKNRLDNIS